MAIKKKRFKSKDDELAHDAFLRITNAKSYAGFLDNLRAAFDPKSGYLERKPQFYESTWLNSVQTVLEYIEEADRLFPPDIEKHTRNEIIEQVFRAGQAWGEFANRRNIDRGFDISFHASMGGKTKKHEGARKLAARDKQILDAFKAKQSKIQKEKGNKSSWAVMKELASEHNLTDRRIADILKKGR